MFIKHILLASHQLTSYLKKIFYGTQYIHTIKEHETLHFTETEDNYNR